MPNLHEYPPAAAANELIDLRDQVIPGGPDVNSAASMDLSEPTAAQPAAQSDVITLGDRQAAELAQEIEILEEQERITDRLEEEALAVSPELSELIRLVESRNTRSELKNKHPGSFAKARKHARSLLGLIDSSRPVEQQIEDEAVVAGIADELSEGVSWGAMEEKGYIELTQALVREGLLKEAMKRHPSSQGYNQEQEELLQAEQIRLGAPRLMETRGYAEEAPFFDEQLEDDSRTAPFTYNHLPPHMESDGWGEEEMSEIEGLRDLETFLSFFIASTTDQDGNPMFPDDFEQANSILYNLTFIGEKEYQKGAEGIGRLWKAYLDLDPARKICIVTGISNSDKYPGKIKSDVHLKEHVMQTLSPEDLEKYTGRIVDNLEDIKGEKPKNVRVVLLDDWALSGRQLSRAYRDMVKHRAYRKFANSIEANLLVASHSRIVNGLEDPDDPRRKPIKVRSYYQSHYAPLAQAANEGHVASAHCTPNLDFGDTIEHMIKRLDSLGILYELPPLASIVPPYKRTALETAK